MFAGFRTYSLIVVCRYCGFLAHFFVELTGASGGSNCDFTTELFSSSRDRTRILYFGRGGGAFELWNFLGDVDCLGYRSLLRLQTFTSRLGDADWFAGSYSTTIAQGVNGVYWTIGESWVVLAREVG